MMQRFRSFRAPECQDSTISESRWCPGVYRSLIVESFDGNSIIPHLFSIAVVGKTSKGLFLDRLVGPANHSQNCPVGVSCPGHLTTAFGLVKTSTEYFIAMNGTNPQTLRLHLSNAAPTDAILVHISYDVSQTLKVWSFCR
jgi:hypothetical protein